MKILKILCLTVSLLLLAAIPVMAGEQTLFGNSNDSVSVWGIELKGAPSYGGNPGLWLGGYSGKIMNDGSLYLGSAGYLLVTPTVAPTGAPPITGFDTNICLFYFGLNGEYVLNPSSLIHVSGSMLVGLCYAKYLGIAPGNVYNIDDGISGLFLMAEPGVNVMMNVTESFKAGVGVSYRFVSGPDLEGLANGDLSALSVNLILRFVEF